MTTATDQVDVVRGLLLAHPGIDHDIITDRLRGLCVPPAGTLREWMRERQAASVTTLQVTVTADGKLANVWDPGPRTVDTLVAASYVMLGNSRRDYAGCRVIAQGVDAVAVSCPFGDDHHVIVYRVVPS